MSKARDSEIDSGYDTHVSKVMHDRELWPEKSLSLKPSRLEVEATPQSSF